MRLATFFVTICLVLACREPAWGAQQPEPSQQRFEDLLPAQKLGARVRTVDRAVGVAPVVLVVPDERSFVEAIARWSPASRFPVLLDDGTPEAREAIARFVNAFEPDRVLRWQAPDALNGWGAEERREAIDAAVVRAWGGQLSDEVQPMPSLIRRWRELDAPPPGVVVVAPGDGAWTAGLALSAARMQPIVWLGAPGGINQTISDADADAFCDALEASLTALGLQWNELGDEIDAVTLCMNAPARLVGEAHGTTAFTARVGRAGSAARSADRWAWCGHVFGSSATTAASAMASIFLPTQRAWLFESYPDDPPWSNYALSTAAEIYRQIGLDVQINNAASRGLGEFLHRSSTALDANLIAVNTKGRLGDFQLSPGKAAGRDVPILSAPAAVYFVHSFSAQRPGVNTSVAGAWLSRGAFAYMGSVDEPGLQSFVPQVTFAARLGSLFPFGAAGREDGLLENRKLATIGDPLWMLDPQPRKRAMSMPDFEGAATLESLAQSAIEADALGEATWHLRMAGRNETLVDLAMATLRDEPGRVDAQMAEASTHALFEAGERRAVAAMFARLPSERQRDVAIEDLAWHALRPLLEDPEAAATMARLLSPHVRPQKLVEDARTLAEALARTGNAGEGRTLLRNALNQARTDDERNAIEAALANLGRP
ncbi:hypothetical protein AY599_18455 [Leptolyngbya valderiana BDU 20041]|nr:hypothetical protein AY599_18455 [Leptolyngbya valderiana BDU 20041]